MLACLDSIFEDHFIDIDGLLLGVHGVSFSIEQKYSRSIIFHSIAVSCPSFTLENFREDLRKRMVMVLLNALK
jgi:hypothetical protein